MSDTYTKTGFSYWNDGSRKLKKHQESNVHSDCVKLLDGDLSGNQRIDEALDKALKCSKDQNNSMLVYVIRALLFLSRQNLAIRGKYNSSQGDFIEPNSNLIQVWNTVWCFYARRYIASLWLYKFKRLDIICVGCHWRSAMVVVDGGAPLTPHKSSWSACVMVITNSSWPAAWGKLNYNLIPLYIIAEKYLHIKSSNYAHHRPDTRINSFFIKLSWVRISPELCLMCVWPVMNSAVNDCSCCSMMPSIL